MNYKSLPVFLFRSPAFDWNTIQSELHLKSIPRLLQKPDIQLALFTASPSFFLRVEERLKTESLSEAELLKIAQYLIRMCTRSVPFGFFSGVGVGRVTSSDSWPTDLAATAQRLLFSVSPEKQERFLVNPTLITFGDQARFLRDYNQNEDVLGLERVEIPQVVRRFLAGVTSAQTRQELASQLRHKNATKDEKHQLIEDLIETGLLVRAKTPLFENAKPQVFNSHLRALKETYAKNSSQAAGLVFKSECELSSKNAEKILSATEKMLELFPAQRLYNQQSILPQIKEFLLANSENKPLPLLSLTQDVLPARTAPIEQVPRSIENYLAKKLATFQKMRTLTWTLSENDFRDLRELKSTEDSFVLPAALTALVTFSRSENWQASLDFATSGSAARLHGRFAPWDSKIEKLAQDIQQIETDAHKDALTADIEYRPIKSRIWNVMIRRSTLPYYIDAVGSRSESKERIQLSDLALFLKADQSVGVMSLSHNKEAQPFMTHAYSHQNDENLYYRILTEIAQKDSASASWMWGSNQQIFPYFPRVVVGGVIVSKRMWNLGDTNYRSWAELNAVLLENEIPRHVYWCLGDQKLFLDLESEIGQKILMAEIAKKHPSLFLQEVIGEPGSDFEALVTGQRASSALNTSIHYKTADDKGFHAGDQCVYLKIYADPADFDSILLQLYKKIIGLQKTRPWFYVKYTDGQPHLRLRLFVNRPQAKLKLRSILNDALQPMINARLIYRTEESQYTREIQRYGGVKGCELFERLSTLDSRLILEFVREIRSQGEELSPEIIVSLGRELTLYWLHLLETELSARIACSQAMLDHARSPRANRKP